MKECDILGVKTYSEPSYIFSRGHDLLTSRIYAPGFLPKNTPVVIFSLSKQYNNTIYFLWREGVVQCP